MSLDAGSKTGWKVFALPFLAWAVFFVHHSYHNPLFSIIVIVALIAATLQGVHHAEVIAQRLGEPFGTMVLALAITAIEAALIISLMMASGEEGRAIARDTVFAAVMIILNGMVGISIFSGSIRFREQKFILEGVNAALITLTAISILTLILPNYTVSVPGPYYSNKQLMFVSFVSLVLYATFAYVQNFQHKDHFVERSESTKEVSTDRPTSKQAWISGILMVVCLGAVVMLAESLAPDLNAALVRYNAPIRLPVW